MIKHPLGHFSELYAQQDRETVAFGMSLGNLERLKIEVANACSGFWRKRGIEEKKPDDWHTQITKDCQAGKAKKKAESH